MELLKSTFCVSSCASMTPNLKALCLSNPFHLYHSKTRLSFCNSLATLFSPPPLGIQSACLAPHRLHSTSPYHSRRNRLCTTMVTSDGLAPWRVVVTRRVPAPAMTMLHEAKPALELDVWDSDDPMPHDKLLESLSKGADALYCVLTDKIGVDVLDVAGPRLKIVSTMSVGYNHINVAECKRRSIIVGNTPDVLTETTADTAVGLVLAASRRFKEATDSVVDGTWGTWSPMGMCGMDVHSSTVGIIGLGRIGAAVARRLKAFNCTIIYSGRSPKPELADPLDAKFVTLEELLQQSDIVIPLCPLNASTAGMFDETKFSLMKKSAVFVNAARGELVNQEHLLNALNEGTIYAAGLDVTAPEPLPTNNPLIKCPNCFILPHIGSASEGTRTAMATLASRNLLAAYYGNALPSEVKM